MKKLVILFLTLLLISTFVIAAENETEDKLSELKDKVSSTKLGDIGNQTKAQAESILEKEITIPALSIFGIKDGKLTQQQLIIFVIFIILTFIVFLEVAAFLPFLDHKIISGDIIPFEMTLRPIFALILTLIPAVMGTIYFISNFFYTFASSIGIIGKLGGFQIFLWIILAIFLFIVFSWTSKKITQGRKLEKAEEFGQRTRQVDAINKIKIKANE